MRGWLADAQRSTRQRALLAASTATSSGGTILALTVPLAVALVIWLTRNELYFGHLLSSGYDLQVKQDYPEITHGLMNWRYIWPNFVVDFLNVPTFNFASPYALRPTLDMARGGNGTSVFFTTPLLLLFFLRHRTLAPAWLQRTLWACIVLLVGFSLLWNGTGWWQVGSRYLFDAYPYVFALLALWRARIDARFLVLAAAGVSINIALSHTFWCHYNQCLGVSGSHHWQIFDALLWAGPVLAVAAWFWLRAAPPRRLASDDPLPQDKATHEDQWDGNADQAKRDAAPAVAHHEIPQDDNELQSYAHHEALLAPEQSRH